MRKVEIALWVLLAVFVGVPLLFFFLAFGGVFPFQEGGLREAAMVAGVFLGLLLIVALLIPLGINGALVFGLHKANRHAGRALRLATANVAKVERPVDGVSRRLVQPNLWLYSRAAWVDGFLRGLLRPRQS